MSEDGRFNRRVFLKAGVLTALGLTTGITIWKANSSIDYIFFPEKHRRTPVNIIVDYAVKNGIETVALEGLPQGKIGVNKFSDLQIGYKEYRNKVDAFDGRLFEVFPEQKILRNLDQLLQHNVISKQLAQQMYEQIYDMLSAALNSYACNLDIKKVGNQFRYCEPLLKKEIQVLGVEDKELYKKCNKDIYTHWYACEFYLMQGLFKINLKMWHDRASKKQDKDATIEFATLSNRVAELIKSEGIRRDDWKYEKELLDNLAKQRDEIGVKQRSEVWMEYLKDFNDVMIVHGKKHTPVNKEIAERQGKKYKIVRDGLEF